MSSQSYRNYYTQNYGAGEYYNTQSQQPEESEVIYDEYESMVCVPRNGNGEMQCFIKTGSSTQPQSYTHQYISQEQPQQPNFLNHTNNNYYYPSNRWENEYSPTPYYNDDNGQIQEQELAYGNENVVQLDPEHFDEFIESDPYNLIAFHSPTCGHCRDLAPEFGAAATELNNDESTSEFKMAAIDCSKYSEFCDRQNINGYPTLRSYSSPTKYTEYKDERKKKNLVQHMKSLKSSNTSTNGGINKSTYYNDDYNWM